MNELLKVLALIIARRTKITPEDYWAFFGAVEEEERNPIGFVDGSMLANETEYFEEME